MSMENGNTVYIFKNKETGKTIESSFPQLMEDVYNAWAVLPDELEEFINKYRSGELSQSELEEVLTSIGWEWEEK